MRKSPAVISKKDTNKVSAKLAGLLFVMSMAAGIVVIASTLGFWNGIVTAAGLYFSGLWLYSSNTKIANKLRGLTRLLLIIALGFAILLAAIALLNFGFGLYSPGEAIAANETEELVVEKVNEQRQEAGLATLSYHQRAADEAREHAQDMSENDYFDHTSLDGETQLERYAFCRGGENIAKTWVNTDVETEAGTERYTTNEELATGIFEQWMRSTPHREQGIYGDWRSAGVGIAITDEGEVYAVMGFCSV